MTVILVLMTFAIFLLIDYVHAQKFAVKQPALQAVKMKRRPVRFLHSLPDSRYLRNLRYHPGHTWALSESPDRVRVGMDDFASKLVGKIERMTLPQRGRWIRQGQKLWTIFRDGKSVDMVSPIEGTISDINEAVVNDPELAPHRSLRRRLDDGCPVARREDQFPQPARRRAGPLVDRRVRTPLAAREYPQWLERWRRMAVWP